MLIVIFCTGFSDKNGRLQPWLTLLELSQTLVRAGHAVTLATNTPTRDLPFAVKQFKNLRGTNSSAICAWLASEQFDSLIVEVSPFSLATALWYSALPHSRTWAYLPYSLYTTREIRAAMPWLSHRDCWAYGRNLLLPRSFWLRKLKDRFAGVICQSHRTANRLGSSVRTTVIPPGTDLSFWKPADSPTLERNGAFLYVGGAHPIRGYPVLLEAMERLPSDVRLRVLARGLDAEGEARWRRDLAKRGLTQRVVLHGGWLSREELREEIQGALAVVLPFVLVPSEMPVSVLEVIASGTPAIVSDIDGLPGAVGDAGMIVSAGNPSALAQAMVTLARSTERKTALRRACLEHRTRFPSWKESTSQWLQLLNAGK